MFDIESHEGAIKETIGDDNFNNSVNREDIRMEFHEDFRINRRREAVQERCVSPHYNHENIIDKCYMSKIAPFVSLDKNMYIDHCKELLLMLSLALQETHSYSHNKEAFKFTNFCQCNHYLKSLSTFLSLLLS